MSTEYEFDNPERFTVGARGEAGSRLFLLQCAQSNTVLTLKVEKSQVALLASYLAGHLPEDLDANVDLEPAWVVGSLEVAYEEEIDRFVVLAEEFTDEDQFDLSTARFTLTREQAAAFAIHATRLVEAGRPACPLCGFPLDPSGHDCPRTNGHRPPTT